MTVLEWVLTAACAVVAICLVGLIALDRRPGDRTLTALLGIEAGLVALVVWGVVRLFGAHHGVNVAAYLGYLVGALLILPIGYVWSAGERSRGGTAVLLVAVVVLPVLFWRLHMLWSPHA